MEEFFGVIVFLIFVVIIILYVKFHIDRDEYENQNDNKQKPSEDTNSYSFEMQTILNSASPQSVPVVPKKNKASTAQQKKSTSTKTTERKTPSKKPAGTKQKKPVQTPANINSSFLLILQKIKSERGFSIFQDYLKCKSLIQDYTAGEYKKETRQLLVAIEAGCPGEIIRSTDPEITTTKLINKLNEEYSLEKKASKQIIELLYKVYNEGEPK
jgi:hypothetical protein